MLQKGHKKMLGGGESAIDINYLQDLRRNIIPPPGHHFVSQYRGQEQKINKKLIQFLLDCFGVAPEASDRPPRLLGLSQPLRSGRAPLAAMLSLPR